MAVYKHMIIYIYIKNEAQIHFDEVQFAKNVILLYENLEVNCASKSYLYNLLLIYRKWQEI